jgi:outer membrane protein assembly factor BamA
MNALYDSRDHTIDPYKGIFLQLTYRYNSKLIGSNKNSSSFYGEFRAYQKLSSKIPRHLIAFWTIVNILVSGELPYLDLPAIGYDMRGKSGRGYTQGRFRGQGLVYGEAEYRFPLTNNGFLGGIVFLNATTTSRKEAIDPSKGINEPGLPLFKSIKPAGGFGLRLMANKNARMNLEIDFGIGANGSKGIYIAVGEAF